MIFEVSVFLIVLFTAGLIQGACGFGFGLVAVSLLSAIMNVKDASIGLVIASLFINIFIFWKLRSHFSFERITPLLISSLIGIPLGITILIRADEILLKRILSIVLIIAIIQGVLPKLRKKQWHSWWLGIPCGLFSGALSGAFATGGPPVVAYLSSQNFKNFRYVASLQVVLGTGAVIRLVILGITNNFNTKMVYLNLTGALTSCLGAYLGLQILKKINRQLLRKIILYILAIMAIALFCN